MTATLRIQHGTADFDRWLAAFHSDPLDRAGSGVRKFRVQRLVARPNEVVIDLDFDDAAAAEAFHLRLQAMWRGPVGATLDGISAFVAQTVEEGEH